MPDNSVTISENNIEYNFNKYTLNFNDSRVEKEFKKENFEKSLKGFRIAFVFVIILYSAFGFLDYFYASDFYKEFFVIRYFFVFPILAGVLLFSFHRKFILVWQKLISFCFLVGGSGIIYMVHKNPDNIFYYGGMFLIFIGGYFIVKLRFYWAAIPGILLIVGYNLSAFFLSRMIYI